MIKLIVFDFDGTLADTRQTILKIVKNELPKLGYSVSKKFLHSLGKVPIAKSLSLLTNNKEEISEIMKILAGKFVSHCKEFAPAPGFYRLKNLKQKKIVLSNSITGIIKSAFINFKGDFFDAVYASDSFRNKAERFIEIIKQEGLEKEEVLYVGDMGVDSELAREVGCKSAIVFGSASWDTLSEIIKSKPDFIIARLDELERIVN